MDIYTIRNKEPLDVLIFSSVDGGFIYAFRFWTVIIYKNVLRLIRKFVDEIINNFTKEIISLLNKSNIDLRIIGAILDNLISICKNGKTKAKMDAVCWIHSFLESVNQLFIQESELNRVFLPRIPFILSQILDLLNHDE